MAQAAVGPDLLQPLDVERHLAAQVALDLDLLVDHVAQPPDLLVAEGLDACVRIDVGDGQDAAGDARPDAVDVGEGHLDALVARDVNAGDSSHLSVLSLPLVMFRGNANHADFALPLDHFALVTDLLDRRSHFHRSPAFFTMRPRPGSTEETSTETRSPGRTRRNRSLAAGATWATI